MEALYSVMPESLLWQILLKTQPHIPRAVLDLCILKSGLTFDSWMASSAAMEEPAERM
jgi:hypothetical protein